MLIFNMLHLWRVLMAQLLISHQFRNMLHGKSTAPSVFRTDEKCISIHFLLAHARYTATLEIAIISVIIVDHCRRETTNNRIKR